MSRGLRNLLIAALLLAGCVAQAGTVFLLYGYHVLEFISILIITLGPSFAFYFALLARCLKRSRAAGFATLLTLAAEYLGVFFAFNTYGT